jgi:aldose 1-epimerase
MSAAAAQLPSGEQIELAHGAQRAVVVEVGGALRAYAVDGADVLEGYGAGEMCSGARGQTFVPWPNRLRDGAYRFDGREHQLPLSEPERRNAIHGLVRWQSFAPREQSAARVVMEHRLHPRPGYPFALRIAVEYVLDDGGLTVRTTATNVGRGRCPYATGAHPYLTVGTPRVDEALLRCPARTRLLSDDRAIPTATESVAGTAYDFRTPRRIGDLALDTGFADLERAADGTATIELARADGERHVRLWMGPAYRYAMLFTGDTLPQQEHRRRALGVEPMTAAPNALQSGEGLEILEPGASHAAAWGICAVRRGAAGA